MRKLFVVPMLLTQLASVSFAASSDQPRDAQGRYVKKSTKFTCTGIGKGQHYKGMTESECIKMGGKVQH
jgi:hypothetical protein